MRSRLTALLVAALVSFGVVTPASASHTALFFSEYVEGSSNNKALELYNGTASEVHLAGEGYNIVMFLNGSLSAGLTVNLSGFVAAGDVFVLAHASASAAILGRADQVNGSGWFNGDDTIVLRRGTVVVDSIGQLGVDPGTEWGSGLTSTADNTLRRREDVEAGDTNPTDSFDPSLEWEGYATDTFDGLGTHCCSPPPAPTVRIRELQGAEHRSPLDGAVVADVPGIVTATGDSGFWLQDPVPDADDRTSEGVFVRTDSAPTVALGDALLVDARVTEISATSTDLTVTALTQPVVTVVSTGNPLPPPVVIGVDRIAPTTVIDDDEFAVFDPATDGIDFMESLEGMRVEVRDAVVVGPTNTLGEVVVLPQDGAGAGERTPRGGILLREGDANPERVILDDLLAPGPPAADVGDRFAAPVLGVLDYSFGNPKLLAQVWPDVVPGSRPREAAVPATTGELAVASANAEDLSTDDPSAKFAGLAHEIVVALGAPDLVSLQQVQDDNGAVNDGTVDAAQTVQRLVDAIASAGGPAYRYADIDPVDGADGGEPGGNTRVGFLYRVDRGLALVQRPGADATTANDVVPGPGGPTLRYSPGRLDPMNSAFANSRKPLAAEFTYNGERLFVVGNHWNSRAGDQPLWGRFQPPARSTEVQRAAQAQVVATFVEQLLDADPGADVVVLGDLNDVTWSAAVRRLEAAGLRNLYDDLPQAERYSHVFEGNAEALDHILVSADLSSRVVRFDAVHANAEFAEQVSDHDPLVATLALPLPELAVADAEVVEGDRRETTTLRFDVVLSRASTEAVRVAFTTADGTARSRTGAADFDAVAGTLTIPSGALGGTVEVTVHGDRANERDETLSLLLSDATGATLVDAAATGTIRDDDPHCPLQRCP